MSSRERASIRHRVDAAGEGHLRMENKSIYWHKKLKKIKINVGKVPKTIETAFWWYGRSGYS